MIRREETVQRHAPPAVALCHRHADNLPSSTRSLRSSHFVPGRCPMGRHSIVLMTVSLVMCSGSVIAADEPTARVLDLTLDLHDGSHLIGSMAESAALRLRTAFGELGVSVR